MKSGQTGMRRAWCSGRSGGASSCSPPRAAARGEALRRSSNFAHLVWNISMLQYYSAECSTRNQAIKTLLIRNPNLNDVILDHCLMIVSGAVGKGIPVLTGSCGRRGDRELSVGQCTARPPLLGMATSQPLSQVILVICTIAKSGLLKTTKY